MRVKRDLRPVLGMGLLVLFALALALGILWGDRVVWKFHLNNWIREPLPILMYHHVAEDWDDPGDNEMIVTLSKLEEDFAYIRDHGYTPVLPRALLSGGPLPDKPVLLTFDDGYASNYYLLYPLLQKWGYKAVISPIVRLTDLGDEGYCTWDMYREMAASGLVEVGSHSYALHNLDNHGLYNSGGPNGVQRLPGETDRDFELRVLDDIRKSYDRLEEELGIAPVCFAYPFGAKEPDAQELIDSLFPVSFVTWPGTADLFDGTARMIRWTVSMETPLSEYMN